MGNEAHCPTHDPDAHGSTFYVDCPRCISAAQARVREAELVAYIRALLARAHEAAANLADREAARCRVGYLRYKAEGHEKLATFMAGREVGADDVAQAIRALKTEVDATLAG